VSDWFGSHSTAPTMNAGMDLEMPGPSRDRGQKLLDAVAAGEVTPDMVRQRATNVLRLMDRTGALDDHAPWQERAEDRPAHRALIRRAGAEAAVLLKNDGLLPLDPAKRQRLAVIGPNAKVAQIMGGGSAQLNPHYAVSPWQGMVPAFGEDRLSFAEGTTNRRFEPLLQSEFAVDYFDSPDLGGAVMHRETQQGSEAFLIGPVGGGKVDADRWSARFTTEFVPTASGEHRVGIAAAGLARVKIDGKLVVDDWSNWQRGRTFFEEGSDEVVGTLAMVAGQAYRVEIEFARRPAAVLGIAAFRMGIGLPLGDAAIAEAAAVARAADVAVVCVGRSGEWDTEGSDLLDIRLPGRQDDLVRAVAAANPRTVVVLQTGGPVEMPWLGDVAAVLEAWYPGQEAGNAIADVLAGAAEPGGRLPQSFPVRWNDNPAQSQDREVYPGLAGKVRYEEGVFVGYRHYDRHGIAPLFPFGFGLSYTSTALEDFAVDDGGFESDGRVVVSVTVRNRGARAGSEVVQLYVGDETASVPRPVKELKAFIKVHLGAGEARRVSLELGPRDFAFFDVVRSAWSVEPGVFALMLGTSATAIAFTAAVRRVEPLTVPV
jgi:beta-glucosidase